MINHRQTEWMPCFVRLWFFAATCVALLFTTPAAQAQSEAEFAQQRKTMVEYAVRRAGVKDPRVLKALNSTPRHQFVPKPIRGTRSYLDAGVPIGEAQTISSPFIVAYMTQELDPKPTDKVLGNWNRQWVSGGRAEPVGEGSLLDRDRRIVGENGCEGFEKT